MRRRNLTVFLCVAGGLLTLTVGCEVLLPARDRSAPRAAPSKSPSSTSTAEKPKPPPPKTDSPTVERARFTRNIDAVMDAIGVKSLELHCGRGNLKVTAIPDAVRIEARAIVTCEARRYAEAERLGNDTQFILTGKGTENPTLTLTEPARLSTEEDFRADLTVVVPPTVRVTIHDGEGDIEVHGLTQGLEITSPQGTVEVYGVAGGLTVNTQGERCIVQDARGLVWVKDGTGSLSVSQVSGEVRVEDTRGPLKILFVTGNVTAENNPDGIEIINIDGDVLLVDIPATRSIMKGDFKSLRFASSPIDPDSEP